MDQTPLVGKCKMLIVAADKPIILSRSPLLDLPGELRNRIYEYVFGSKTLHILAQYIGNHQRCKDHHGRYNLRLTCRQIAKETEHYPFRTLEFSGELNKSYYYNASGNVITVQDQQEHFGRMMQSNWSHVRHLIIHSTEMKSMLINSSTLVPEFPALVRWEDRYNSQTVDYSIIWPEDARNLTTITIHDMNKRKAEERERLLKVLRFYFPKLVDVRCSYSGDYPWMRRYRLTDDGQLMWWYSGQLFKTLPEAPTALQWFNDRCMAFGWYDDY